MNLMEARQAGLVLVMGSQSLGEISKHREALSAKGYRTEVSSDKVSDRYRMWSLYVEERWLASRGIRNRRTI